MKINLQRAIATAIGAESSTQCDSLVMPTGSGLVSAGAISSFFDASENATLVVPDRPGAPAEVSTGQGYRAAVLADSDRDDMEFGHRSTFSYPPALKSEQVSGSVWNAWFGSAKNASRAAEILSRARVPEATLMKRALCASLPTSIITMIATNPLLVHHYKNALSPAEYSATHPACRLDKNIQQLIGDRYEVIRTLIVQLDAVGISKEVVTAWPFMATLYDNGCYGLFHASALLWIAELRNKLIADGQIKGTDRQRILLATNMLLNTLPPRLAALVVITTPAFKDAVVHTAKLFNLTACNLDHERSIWDQIGPEATQSTITYLMDAASAVARLQPTTDTQIALHDMEVRQVIFSAMPRTMQSLYLQFCRVTALPKYDRLRATFDRCAQALEIKIDQRFLTADLIGRPVDFNAPDVAVSCVQRLKQLISDENSSFPIERFVDECESRLAKIASLHDKLADLTSVRSAGNMLQVTKLAEAVREAILSCQLWLNEAVEASKSYVEAWESFYRDLRSEMPAQPVSKTKAGRTQSSDPMTSAPIDTTVVKSESAVVKDLRSQLTTAEANEAHLREELRVSRAEVHGLRLKTDALNALAPVEGQIVCDLELIRRVAMRTDLSAGEVLAYFAFIGGGRVEVLKSAWRSVSGYAAPFSYASRMVELLNKLVFEYLPLIVKGTPDSQARQVFSPKAYKSEESDATICDTRMRKMREFEHQGERRVFERHLCVSNKCGREGMRLYFEVINGVVVIAYAGPHLDVKRTN
jgi:hypothetical protein